MLGGGTPIPRRTTEEDEEQWKVFTRKIYLLYCRSLSALAFNPLIVGTEQGVGVDIISKSYGCLCSLLSPVDWIYRKFQLLIRGEIGEEREASSCDVKEIR